MSIFLAFGVLLRRQVRPPTAANASREASEMLDTSKEVLHEASNWDRRGLFQRQGPRNITGLVQDSPRHRRPGMGGTAFSWLDDAGTPANGTTVWSIGDGSDFVPGKAPFMINYRVADLYALIEALREEGCQVLDEADESEYGKFGWVIDPEGNKVELWQPPEGQ